MRISKLFAPVLAVAGLFVGLTAVADSDPAAITDFIPVAADASTVTFVVQSTPDAVGSTCYITGNGTVLAAFAIAPGANVVTVPAGAAEYTAAGPTVDGKWYNPGSN